MTVQQACYIDRTVQVNLLNGLMSVYFGRRRVCVVCLWCASHLQGVGLSEVSHPSDLHGDPDVDHLGRDVAQRQVADHYLLSLGGRGETHMLGGGVSGPG